MTPPPAIADVRPALFTDLSLLEALHAEPSLSQRDDAEITEDVTLAKVVVLIDREVTRPECPDAAVVEFA